VRPRAGCVPARDDRSTLLEQRCHLRPSKLRGNKCRGCPGRGRIVNFAGVSRARARALSGRKREGEEGEKSVRAPVVENSNPSIRAALRGVTRIRAKRPRDGKSGSFPFQGIPRWGGKWNVKRVETISDSDGSCGRIPPVFHFDEQVPVPARGNGRRQSGAKG